MGPDQLTPDIPVALTASTAQMHLLQRRLLRADGLSSLERDLLLGTVVDTLRAVQQLHERVVLHREQDDTPPH